MLSRSLGTRLENYLATEIYHIEVQRYYCDNYTELLHIIMQLTCSLEFVGLSR